MQEYKLYLQKQGLRDSTINCRLALIKSLKRSGIDVFEASKQDAESFLLSLNERGVSNGYINNLIALFRSISDCFNKDFKIKYWSNKRSEKLILTDDELQQFLCADCYIKPKVKKCWDMFWLISASMGLRNGETAMLHRSQIDLKAGTISLTQTKTGSRVVPIPPAILPVIEEYCADKDYLFKNRSGLPFDRSGWRDDFKKRLKHIGCTKSVSPHSLRHSYITRLLGNGADLYSIQKAVGHSDVKITQIYMHANLESMKKAISNDPLFKSNMPASEKLKTIKIKLREVLESLSVIEDANLQAKITESSGKFEFSVEVV